MAKQTFTSNKEKRKMEKSGSGNKYEKNIPVLKNPATSPLGKIIIVIVCVAMIFSILAGFVYLVWFQ